MNKNHQWVWPKRAKWANILSETKFLIRPEVATLVATTFMKNWLEMSAVGFTT